jgi:transcriptional regulator with XRE-family HTH domain
VLSKIHYHALVSDSQYGSFGARLKRLRLRQALSQRDLAGLAGITQSTVLRLENGRHPPLPSTIRKLARALEVTPADLTRPESTSHPNPTNGPAPLARPGLGKSPLERTDLR